MGQRENIFVPGSVELPYMWVWVNNRVYTDSSVTDPAKKNTSLLEAVRRTTKISSPVPFLHNWQVQKGFSLWVMHEGLGCLAAE